MVCADLDCFLYLLTGWKVENLSINMQLLLLYSLLNSHSKCEILNESNFFCVVI